MTQLNSAYDVIVGDQIEDFSKPNAIMTYYGINELSDDHMSITIDLDRDQNFDESCQIQFRRGNYLLPTESHVQEGLARACVAYATNPEHAQRLYDYVSQGWFMFASPVLASAANKRGCPISCFLSDVGDSREEIGAAWDEVLWLSTEGGGVGMNWSKIRSVGEMTSRGTYTPGLMPFLKAVDSITLASIQGSVRRGASAIYLDVSHPEIHEFLESRRATGGDAHRKIMNTHNAVNIPNSFMEAVKMGATWELVDPHSGKIKEVVQARDLWRKILEVRLETGEPYIHFIDHSNSALPETQKKLGLRVNNSNLCSEITLPTNAERTAVCCLSSVNLEKFDEWKHNELFIGDMVEMLDNVLTVFMKKAPPKLAKAVFSASQERAIGLGTLGFHSFLQKHNIPFESAIASGQNRMIFSHIKKYAEEATFRLGREKGEAPDMVGTGRRNSHLIAIAPNASSSMLCNNVSPSIEPYNANIFAQKTSNGVFVIKNKALDYLLKTKYRKEGEELENIWDSILFNEGSVQHIEWMDQHDKDVFKTAFELDQRWVIDHAGSRQPFICQAQSVNLFILPGTPAKFYSDLHITAWEQGVKCLYYVRSKNLGKAAKTSPSSVMASSCLSCEG